MKAAVVTNPGADPVYGEFDEPVVDEHHAMVELVAAGIHQVVRSRVEGRHYSTRGIWPAVPGIDAVARTPDGTLVYTGFVDPPWGTMAERMAVPGQFGTPLPDGADPVAVAAGMNPGMASWIPLARRRDELASDRQAGDKAGLGTVLVLGATGIAGGLAVDNALALGASAVVAAGRNPDRLAALAERVPTPALRTVRLEPDEQRTADALADALAGRPPSAVIDFCWGSVAEAAFRALGRDDLDLPDADVRYVEVGGTAGPDAALPAALLRSRNVTMSGGGLGGTAVTEILARLPEYLSMIADGRVQVPHTAYPLSEVGAAWCADDGTRSVVVPG